MNFKSLIAVGFGIATIGLSLPAQADTATIVQTDQSAVVTGKRNVTGQSNSTGVTNIDYRNKYNSSGTVIGTSQRVDVLGTKNLTTQTNTTSGGNIRIRNK